MYAGSSAWDLEVCSQQRRYLLLNSKFHFYTVLLYLWYLETFFTFSYWTPGFLSYCRPTELVVPGFCLHLFSPAAPAQPLLLTTRPCLQESSLCFHMESSFWTSNTFLCTQSSPLLPISFPLQVSWSYLGIYSPSTPSPSVQCPIWNYTNALYFYFNSRGKNHHYNPRVSNRLANLPYY